MSSSFQLSGFSTLPLPKEKEGAAGTYNDTGVSLIEPSDEALLALVSRADREALALLFRRHYRLVHWISQKILRDVTEAEDLAQDVFLHIVRKARLYNSAKGSARSWIARATYHQALNRKKYLQNRHYFSSADQEGTALRDLASLSPNEYDHSGEAVFGRARWLQMRSVLTQDQWETIRLHFFEGYTFAEIGKRRNQPFANVRNHFYRGLARLRKYIFQDELRGC